MIEIEHSRLGKYPHDHGSPAFVIVYNVAFSGVEGQSGCPDSCSPGFIVGTKTFFWRQGKGFDLSRLHPRNPLLERGRDNMLALYELLGIAVGRGEVIAKRDLIPHRHFSSVPNHIIIVGSLHWSWVCRGNIHNEPLPEEEGCADRAQK